MTTFPYHDTGELQGRREEALFEKNGISSDTDFMITGGNRAHVLHDAIRAEVYGDASYDVRDLTEDEKDRLHFIAIPTTHTPQFAHEVVARAPHADYVLLESVGLTEQQRLAIDEVDNLLLRGVEIKMPRQNIAFVEALTLQAALDWRSIIQRLYGQSRPENPPVFRTIDIATDNPIFEESHVSIELLAVMADAYDLYGRPYDELKQEALAQLQEVGEVIREREAEQLSDITRVATKAIRLHPDRDRITIAVGVGAAHSMVARNLERLGFSVHVDYAGPAAEMPRDVLVEGGSRYSYDIGTALIREATHLPDEIDESDLDCLLAFRLVQNAIRDNLPLPMSAQMDGRIAHILETAASSVVYEMDADEREQLLRLAEEDQMNARIPLFRNLRLGMSVARTNRTVLQHVENKLGDLGQYIIAVGEELKQR